MLDFVGTIISGVTSAISLSTIATVVASIIGAGIISIFAWKLARKGYNYVFNALIGDMYDPFYGGFLSQGRIKSYLIRRHIRKYMK